MCIFSALRRGRSWNISNFTPFLVLREMYTWVKKRFNYEFELCAPLFYEINILIRLRTVIIFALKLKQEMLKKLLNCWRGLLFLWPLRKCTTFAFASNLLLACMLVLSTILVDHIQWRVFSRRRAVDRNYPFCTLVKRVFKRES